MNIELFWFEGCPNHHAARVLLEAAMAENYINDEIVSIEVPDLETGERVKFAGSPTIRINGIDIEPGYEDTGDYTPRCRVYMTDVGFKGVPQKDWIENAVREARVG